MNPETWSNLLYTYGPNAVLILLIFVIERQVRSAWRNVDNSNSRQQTLFLAIYGLTWLVIFGVAICSVYAWWLINLSRRPQIPEPLKIFRTWKYWELPLPIFISIRIPKAAAT